MKIIEIYLLSLNILGIILVATDKYKAQNGLWRIRERTFFLLSALGGSVGTYGAMRLFHHKTLHKRFMLGLPLIFAAQIILCLLWLRHGGTVQ